MNQDQFLLSYFIKNHFNNINPFAPRSTEMPLSFGFHTTPCKHFLFQLCVPYSYFISLIVTESPKYLVRVQITKLLTCTLFSCFLLLRPKYLLHIIFSNSCNFVPFFRTNHVTYPSNTAGEVLITHMCIFKCVLMSSYSSALIVRVIIYYMLHIILMCYYIMLFF
jgi:hypothetical protein